MARAIDAVQVLNDINWHHKPTPVSEFESGFNRGLNQAMWIITHAPTLTPQNEWVSVEERLPKYNIREDGELISSKILCYCETDKTVHLVASQKFYTGRKGEIVHPVFRYYDEWGDEIENVSHWMPLPTPPDRRPPEGEEDT